MRTADTSAARGCPSGAKIPYLPLVGSGTDKGCETIGVGCVNEGCASVSLGTQATVETTSRRYYELVPFYPPFPGVDPKAFNPEITVYHGFWMINWFIETFAGKEREDYEKRGENLLDYLNGQLLTVPAGSGGLVLQGLDDFVRINDLNSHLFGDGVLRQFAQTVQQLLPPG
ncbi:hypothetical protein NE464_21155, partial [Eubacterium callanderi]|nr:hypothetical protein [Eubacterium callanderi]